MNLFQRKTIYQGDSPTPSQIPFPSQNEYYVPNLYAVLPPCPYNSPSPLWELEKEASLFHRAFLEKKAQKTKIKTIIVALFLFLPLLLHLFLPTDFMWISFLFLLVVQVYAMLNVKLVYTILAVPVALMMVIFLAYQVAIESASTSGGFFPWELEFVFFLFLFLPILGIFAVAPFLKENISKSITAYENKKQALLFYKSLYGWSDLKVAPYDFTYHYIEVAKKVEWMKTPVGCSRDS